MTRNMEISVPRHRHSPMPTMAGSVVMWAMRNPAADRMLPEVSTVGKDRFSAWMMASRSGHLRLQLVVPGGDHDGVVDIGAHLDGGDDQIAQEENGLLGHAGEGKIDPDAALDHQNQQDRQSHRLEGEQQHDDDEHHRQDADHDVVPGKGDGQVIVAGGIAHQIDAVRVVVPLRLLVDGLEESEGLLPPPPADSG